MNRKHSCGSNLSFDRKLHGISIAMLKKKEKTKLSTNIDQTIKAMTIKCHINDNIGVFGITCEVDILMVRNRHVARPVHRTPPSKHSSTQITQ